MLKAQGRQFLAVFAVVFLLPQTADAHTGPILDDLVILAVAHCIVGPAIIVFTRIFEGVRPVSFAGFFIGVACSWMLFFTGRLMGISNETFDKLTEGFSEQTINFLDWISFYGNFIGIPFATLAVIWSIYAVRRKFKI